MDLGIFYLDEKYSNQTKSKIQNVTVPNNDGLIDSIPIACESYSIFYIILHVAYD